MIKTILSNSYWLLIGNLIGKLSMFLTNIIVARVLSQENFGEFSMIRNTISIIEGVISGTFGSPTIKLVAENVYNNEAGFIRVVKSLLIINIVITFVLSILIFIFAPYIVETFFKGQESMMYGLYVGTVILITTTLSGLVQNIFIGMEKYKKLAKSSIYVSLISFPILLFLINYFGLYGALFGVASYFFLDFVIKYFLFRKIYTFTNNSIDFQFLFSELKKLLLFSYPLLASTIISSISFWYARVMIVESEGFSSIAVFDAAFQWLTIIMIITGATTSATLPMLSKSFSNYENNSKKIFRINLVINFLISFLFALVFILLSKYIMSIYGNDYIIGYKDLNILAVTSIFFTLSTVYNRYMVAINKPWIIAVTTFVSACMLYIVYFQNFMIGSNNLSLSILVYYFTSTVIYTCIKLYLSKKDSKSKE